MATALAIVSRHSDTVLCVIWPNLYRAIIYLIEECSVKELHSLYIVMLGFIGLDSAEVLVREFELLQQSIWFMGFTANVRGLQPT